MAVNKIGLIGNGSWATALAKILTDNGTTIDWWMRNEKSAQYIRNKRHNSDYLSSVYFEAQLVAPTHHLLEVIAQNDIILFCTPSAFILDVLNQLPADALKGKIIVSAIKGLILTESCLLNDYLAHHFEVDIQHYVAISGPCHAEEVALERLSYLTFSGLNAELTADIAALFKNEYIATVTNHDTNGAQYAAVLKNIYAVGAGIANGLGYGDNFLSVYVTNCFKEMADFLAKQYSDCNQRNEPNYNTSAYLGDLLVTCYSAHSRNRTFGSLVGKGYFVKSATSEMNMVAEGYYAVAGMKVIIDKLDVEMPIVQAIYACLRESVPANECFEQIEQVLV